ncbi:MAG: YveK family protein [Anaerolineae bacterium]
MPLGEYLRIIRQRGWIVVLTALLAAVSALVFSTVQRPVYQSTIQLNVIGARPDLGLSSTIKSLLRNYAGQIRSYDTAQDALRDMPEPLDLTPEGLLGKVNVQAVEADLQLLIEAEDGDAHVAEMIAQQMADTFVWRIDQFNAELDQADRINVFTSGPASPANRIKPQKKINTIAGGLLGGVAGVGVLLLLEWVDAATVRRPGDIRRDVGLPVLAVVDTSGNASTGPSWLSALAAGWAIPLVGGLALGVLLASIVYLAF